jgi:uncharacterized protein (DUF305 family)
MTENDRGLPRWAKLIVGSLVAAALLFSAYVVGVLTTVERHPGDASPEAGFARDMITHHSQAVEMAMIAWQKGASDVIRTEGYDIATGQGHQIGIMQGWLQQWGLDPTGPDRAMAWMPDAPPLGPGGLMPGMATRVEIDRLLTLSGKDFDILFCQLMLRHHQGGIHMADGVLATTEQPRVRDLAQRIKNSQSIEVEIFRAQLDRFGAKPL